MKNITSCAADGAPNMMGKKNGCLKLMKDENPEMILVHCVIHRENWLFYEEQNADHVRLLIYSEVRWLFKGNSLKRFMELFDTLSDFLSNKPEMKYHLTVDGKASVTYLADISVKLNILNKQPQGTNKTLIDAKAKIFGFITLIELCQKYSNSKNFEQLHWLQKCEVNDTDLLVIVNQLKILSADLKKKTF
ncbi:protein FAM200C-like [Parasteatoda tepidariorum]|uniref:protein FAM200C-like n=1 Tax=Parasteatoda tepidariorum TaxID=114398 RepID=UPI0039BD0342